MNFSLFFAIIGISYASRNYSLGRSIKVYPIDVSVSQQSSRRLKKGDYVLLAFSRLLSALRGSFRVGIAPAEPPVPREDYDSSTDISTTISSDDIHFTQDP